jgi:FKBP-type peptidyl-prolyl cis-trans isomerase FklB
MIRRRVNEIRSTLVSIAILLVVGGCQPPPGEEAAASEPATDGQGAMEIQSEIAQASYSLGYTVASNLQGQFAGGIDDEALISGIVDRLEGRERRVNEADAQRALAALAGKQQQVAQARSDANQAAGQVYLAENSQRDGITTTTSGLQYAILVGAEGAKPGPRDTVTTHYHGTLIDGTVFDSSVSRGEPASFPVNGVIRGWTEALQLMTVGSKWRLYISPDLAYGSRSVGSIPPNSTLIFDVELLSIDEAS